MSSPTPSTEQPPSAAPLLQPFGAYVLVRKLTEGGMAEIFLAKQTGAEGFERNIVIKRLLPHLSEVQEFVRMFLDEARLAARLSHPNIVQIHDLGVVDERYFIAMEYLAGEDFSSTLRAQARAGRYTPFNVVVQVLIEAARGLHHAHEFQDESGRLGVVHRDISPSNLHLTYQGEVKVLDFGIAWAEERLTKTQTGVVKGKYSYMAPEQARGQQVDCRADVYSLGVTLYEALTNIRPLVRENDLAMLNAVLSADYPPPRHYRPEIPPALEQVVLRAMALDPINRYQSAGTFADALEALLPSVGGRIPLGSFLREAFGDERFLERTRIPSLATLRGARPEATTPTTPRPHLASEQPTVSGRSHATPGGGQVLGSPRAAVDPPVSPGSGGSDRSPVPPMALLTSVGPGQSVRRGWLIGAAALGLVVTAVGATWLLLDGGRPSEAPISVPAPPAGTAVAAVPTVDPPAPEPVEPVAVPDAGLAGTGATAQAGALATGIKPEVIEASLTSKKRRPLPSTLTVADIERVVARGQARYAACFEAHKDELPAEKGELQVRISIPSSGRATAQVQGELVTSKVGACVVSAVQRLRFPAHGDQELQVLFPLSWRVTR